MSDTRDRIFLSIGVLLAAFVATPASAEPPGSASGKGPDKATKAAEKAETKAAKADEKAAKADAKADEKAAKADEKAAKAEGKSDKADAKPGEKAEGEHGRGPGEGPGHEAHGHGPGPRGYRALGDDFHHGRLKKAELKERLAAMRENKGERRMAHQAEVKAHWGAALAHPACREELRHHARREAFLDRALFIAQTEVTKDKEKLIERIEKLITKEDERHARAMQRFRSMPPGAGSAAMPSALPTPAAPALPASAAKAGAQ